MTTKPPDSTPSAPSPTDAELFPIVGIGASAGGLEALTQLLKALPPAPGMAFVVVQHLAPAHPSALAEILSRATPMQVLEVQGTQEVLPDHVYVIPPDRSILLVGGELQLRPRETEAHYPINQFFSTLAEHRGYRAIGVVLSGTASDGTLGLERIKGEGGITFAQDATAQHEGMPNSAIASGCVDFVLPPDAIAREIVRIGHQPSDQEGALAPQPGDRSDLAQIVRLLHDTTGVDFSQYRLATLFRRVTRRVAFAMQPSLAAYLQFLRKTPGEVEALYQDILIHVTSFFRDPEAFEVLKRLVFPRLIEGRSANEPVRFWALGCSTGQEAYSLAIAFREAAEAAGSAATLQLFATDLNARCIDKARAGIYAKDTALDVSPERLQRFFTEVDGQYRIAKSIRDVCVFSQHNVLTDPPFLRIDLISCRNLLIYLDPPLHHKILSTLHLALQEQGCLWLGGSETAEGQRNLYKVLDAKLKIYCKIPGGSLRLGDSPLYPASVRPTSPRPVRLRPIEGADLPREADRILSNRFAPPSVLVSAELDIVHYRGDTGPFLAPAPGKASLNLLKMLREGLLLGVRAAIDRSREEGKVVREVGLQVNCNGSCRDVDIEVVPIGAFGGKPGGFLVLFVAAGTSPVGAAGSAPVLVGATQDKSTAGPPDPRHVRLEMELAATREYLQSLTEMQERAIEDLQSANEEVQSANEELQSTNEEMETSKEELQSSHEELITVNHQLNDRNSEMTRVNNDLANVLASAELAIVLIGPDLCVRRFTLTAAALLGMVDTDVGRPLVDLEVPLEGFDKLAQLLAEVIETNRPKDGLVQTRAGRWYSLRLRPYQTPEGKTEGIVVMLVDVDVLKRANAYTQSIVATVREPLLVLDGDLRVQTASRAFYETFRVSPAETENRLLFELGEHQWDIPELRRLLEELLPRDNQVDNFEVERQFGQLGQRTMTLNARRLLQADGQTPMILLAIQDATERKLTAAAVRDSEVRLRFLVDSMPQMITTAKPNGEVDYSNPQWSEFTGLPVAQLSGWGWLQCVHADDVAQHEQVWRHAVESGELFEFDSRIRRADGQYRWHVTRSMPMRAESEQIVMWVSSTTDVHDIKHVEAALQDSETRYRRLFEAAKDGILILDFVNGKIIDSNPYMTELLNYTHDEFLGLELWEIGLFGDRAVNEAAVRELQDKRYLRYEHLPLESKQGRKVMVEVVANAYKEEQHRVIQCNIRDVTERSLLQDQMRGQAVELSDLHRRKDEFLAMLSHELRNPLASITNAVRLLGMEPANESRIQQQARGIIERQMGQLGHLVDDLLEVSRITTGRLQLRRERVAANDVVERAMETVRPTLELRRQVMKVSMPAEQIWLHADAARLEQVVVNLLANAIKFTDHGGHVWLSVGREGDECVLRVRDDGVGIAPELLPRIFDLFTQSEQSLDRSQGGLGIGLTLVHRLTELHGGSVVAHSTLGQGSEFVVRLPIVSGEAAPASTPVTPDALPAHRPLRVLVVDDNVDTVLSFEMLLKAIGHDVKTANDGATALQVVHEYRPDVILLDIGLPGLNGYEVAKRIRQQADVAGTVLVALTGYGQAADRQATKDAGFDHHIVKPANFSNLEKILAGVAAKVAGGG